MAGILNEVVLKRILARGDLNSQEHVPLGVVELNELNSNRCKGSFVTTMTT